MVRKGGKRFWAEVRMTVYEVAHQRLYVTIIRDVSSRVEREAELRESYVALEAAQDQLVQVSKLSAVGQLGAGIAHELNQPLTAIRGFTERILRHRDRSVADASAPLTIIADEASRMTRIVDNLRTFARESHLELTRVDVRVPVENALMLVREQLRHDGVQLTTRYSDELPDVWTGPRRLSVDARANGRYVHVRFENSGPSVPEDVVARLFDPFFTTKPPDRGTGLGLSIAYGILRDHDGEIRYEDPPGGGARFVVSVPILDAGPADG